MVSGRLTVNGRLNANVEVEENGTLAGIGIIGGDLTNEGIVAPGNGDNPLGRLTVTGNYTQESSGTFATTINAAGQNASLAVQNVASLDGQLVVTAQSGFYRPGTRYTLVTAAGGLTGAFAGVTATGLPSLLAPTASYDANDAYLTLEQQSFTTLAATANQRAVAGALDRLLVGNADALAILDNRSDSSLRAALERISGQAYTSIADPQLRSARAFGDQIMSRAYAATFEGGPSGFTLPPAVYAADLGKRQPVPEPRFVQTTRGYGVWATGYGQFGSVTNTANAPGRQETIAGIAAGVDMHPAPGTLIGISAGYGNVDVSVNRTGERIRTDNGQVAIYGGLTNGALYANATVGYARADGRANRNLNLPGLQADARASIGGNQFLSAGEVGYRWAFVPGRTVSPFAGYQVSTFQQERVREGNGLLALNVAQGDFTSARSLVGARVEAVSLAGERSYTIGVKVAYVHEFADVTRNIGSSFALLPAAPFVVGGRALDRDRVLVGAGIGTEFVPGLSGFVNYDAEVARTDMIQSVRGGMRYAF